jgi:hypothetical protein
VVELTNWSTGCDSGDGVTDLAYIAFVFIAALLGTLLGVLGHFARAHLRLWPEKVTDSDILNTLMMDGYLFEKYAVEAEWDDAGYWDSMSLRNLFYYMISGFGMPVLLGLMFWSDRAPIVAATCKILTSSSLHPPLCF